MLPPELAQLLAQAQQPQVSSMPDPLASAGPLPPPAPVAPTKKPVLKKPVKRMFVGSSSLTPEQLTSANPWANMGKPAEPTQEDIGQAADISATPPETSIALKPMLSPNELSLPTMGNAPGNSAENEIKARQLSDMKSTAATWADPETQQKVIEGIYGSRPIQEQMSGINKLEELLKNNAGRLHTGIDYSPLLSLVDSEFGGNLSKNYKAPASENDRTALLSKYAEDIQKQRDELSKQVLAHAAQWKSGNTMQQTLQDLSEKMGVGSKVPAPPKPNASGLGAEKYIQAGAAKIHQDYAKNDALFDQLQGAFTPDPKTGKLDVGTVQRNIPVIARILSLDKGRITNKEISMAMGNTLGWDAAKFEAWLTSNKERLADPALFGNLMNEIKSARARNQAKAQEALQLHEDSLMASPEYAKHPVSAIVAPYKSSIGKNGVEAQKKSESDSAKAIADAMKGL